MRLMAGRRMRRSGALGPTPSLWNGVSRMEHDRHSEAAKVVYVRDYNRFRYGKWEHVSSHFRSWPS